MNSKKFSARLGRRAMALSLTLLGFSSCNKEGVTTVDYGVPYTGFTFIGRAVDASTDQPVNNLLISLTKGQSQIDTIRSFSQGNFSLDYPQSDYAGTTFTIHAEDTDGEANGSYESKDTSITIPDPKPASHYYDITLRLKAK